MPRTFQHPFVDAPAFLFTFNPTKNMKLYILFHSTLSTAEENYLGFFYIVLFVMPNLLYALLSFGKRTKQ